METTLSLLEWTLLPWSVDKGPGKFIGGNGLETGVRNVDGSITRVFVKGEDGETIGHVGYRGETK